MAKPKSSAVQTDGAIILNDDGQPTTPAKPRDKHERLARWVMHRIKAWETWRDANYSKKWDEYERLWRGIFSEDERLRASERSQIVTPALSEAVENAAAELEEAIFGRGADYFDLGSPEAVPVAPAPMPAAVSQAMGAPEMGTNVPEMGMMSPPAPQADEYGVPQGIAATADPAAELDKVRARLKEDLAKTDFATEAVHAILYGAVFGSGFGEVELADVKDQQPLSEGAMTVAKTTTYTCSKLRALNPRNCAWDPNATRLDNGLGFGIVEMVSKHLILEKQKDGTYRKGVDLFSAAPADDAQIAGDQQADESKYDLFNAKQVRYYGLVPKSLLDATEIDGPMPSETEDDFLDIENDEFIEAFVVVINEQNCAKAVRNPFSKQDRPIIHFPWDIVPGRLLGRGICEKGAAPQKILDTEVRSRLDSMAFVTAPMMGMDASRMPKGFKFKVKPGGSILTNGKPSDVMEQFKFGELDPNHYQNAAALKGMVQQATGSVDGAALAQGASDARTGAMSMAMAPIIKRYKRTLVHFLDEFLMPALEKILWRNMQFNKDRYPAVPFKLRAASTMGIMQREYETQQMTGLLQTLEPGTPEHRAILTGIVSQSSIPDREKMMKMIATAEDRAKAEAQAIQAASEDPMLQQLKQVTLQLDLAAKQLELKKTQAEIMKLEAEAEKIRVEAAIAPAEMASKGSYALPGQQQQAVFDQRMKEADLALRAADLDERVADRQSNERIVTEQIKANLLSTAMKEDNRERIERRKADSRANKSV